MSMENLYGVFVGLAMVGAALAVTCALRWLNKQVELGRRWREEEKMAAGWNREEGLPPTVCGACGDTFVPKFRGARECFRCWAHTQAGRDWRARKDREQRGEAPRWNGIDRRRTASNALVSLDATFVRKLLQLCHPDKHKNSDLANMVTVELLKMKDRL